MSNHVYQILYWGSVPVQYILGEYRATEVEAAIRQTNPPSNVGGLSVGLVRMADDTAVATAYQAGTRRLQIHFTKRESVDVMLQAIVDRVAQTERVAA